eukprot:15907-Heterococcus_DN1.PRE.3
MCYNSSSGCQQCIAITSATTTAAAAATAAATAATAAAAAAAMCIAANESTVTVSALRDYLSLCSGNSAFHGGATQQLRLCQVPCDHYHAAVMILLLQSCMQQQQQYTQRCFAACSVSRLMRCSQPLAALS